MGEGMQELLRQMASKIFGEAASPLFACTWWCPAVPSMLPHKGRGAARRENVKKSGLKLCDVSVRPPKIIHNTLNTDMTTALFSSVITKEKRQMQIQYGFFFFFSAFISGLLWE